MTPVDLDRRRNIKKHGPLGALILTKADEDARRVRRARTTTLRFRRGDPDHNLLAAVQHYIRAHGGAVVVIGGVELQRDPLEPGANFKIAVRCTGRVPTKASPVV